MENLHGIYRHPSSTLKLVVSHNNQQGLDNHDFSIIALSRVHGRAPHGQHA